MSKTDSGTRTIQNFAKQNAVWIFTFIFTIANLFIASLLSPLKEDIRALAEKQDSVEVQVKDILINGTIPSKINEERVKSMGDKLDDIEARQTRMEDKIDKILEKSN